MNLHQQNDKRNVLIIGASSGIGKATARLFAEQGFRVFGTSRRQRPVELRSNTPVFRITYLIRANTSSSWIPKSSSVGQLQRAQMIYDPGRS